MSTNVATNLAGSALASPSHSFAAAGPANDAAPSRRSSLFLLFSTKWVSLGPVRLPVWAHVGVLLVDRAGRKATLYDVVSCGARKGVRS